MSYRIVLAEDEPLARRDLAELLAEMGHQVVAQARDGRAALALVEEEDPDLVILDVMMPQLDGIETARRIARERPVVIITALTDPTTVSRAQEAGVMAYLGKPFREQDIGPALQLAVSHFLTHAALSERVKRLTEQLEARKLVDRARALLIQHEGLPESEAYRRLQQLSMERNLPMVRIAEAVVAAFS